METRIKLKPNKFGYGSRKDIKANNYFLIVSIAGLSVTAVGLFESFGFAVEYPSRKSVLSNDNTIPISVLNNYYTNCIYTLHCSRK